MDRIANSVVSSQRLVASAAPQGSASSFSEAGPAPQGSGGLGLVSRETKRTENPVSAIFPGFFSNSEFASLGRERRVRRVRSAVLAKARAVNGGAVGGFRWTGAFITLTYRDRGGWRPGDMRLFMDAASEFGRRRGVRLRYVWVAELQQRGAVHYHLVVWWPARLGSSFKLPKPDDAGWWPHGMSNIRRLRSGGEAYLAKYVSKGDVGAFPRGLRLYGMDRHGVDALAVHRACLPRWVADGTAGRVDRVSFLGWVSRATGEIFRSRLRLVRERAGSGVVWRFVPAIERDGRCLECLFNVMRGGFANER